MERTDRLAVRLGISLRAMAPGMGLSVASLFGYRNGSIPISAKGWSKLEQLERRAARVDSRKNAESKANPKDPGIGIPAYAEREESGTTLRDEPMFYPPQNQPDDLLDVLKRIANALERIADQV